MYHLTVPSLLAMTAVVILAIQGMVILARANIPQNRWLGWLTLLLAALGLVAHVLFFSNALVLSPELGIGMVQGSFGRYGLVALLVGLAIGLGMSQCMARSATGLPSSSLRLLGIGLLVGFVSAWRLLPLNADDVAAPTIYAYDLWFPPLLIWLLGSMLEVGFNILRWPRPRPWVEHLFTSNPQSPHVPDQWRAALRAWISTFAIALLALWALHHQALNDPLSADWWAIILRLELCMNVVLAIWLAICLVGPLPSQLRTRIILAMTFVSAIIGLISAELFLMTASLMQMKVQVPTGMSAEAVFRMRVIASCMWLGTPVLVFGILGVRQLTQGQRLSLPQIPGLPSGGQAILLLALAMLTLSIAAILYDVINIGPAVALTSFILAWLLLTEVVTKGLLQQGIMQVHQQKLRALTEPVKRGWAHARPSVSASKDSAVKSVKSVISLPSATVAIVKGLVAIALLIAVSELSNRGRTVFQPFKAYGISEEDGVGRAVSDRVIDMLRVLNEQFQPPIIVPAPSSSLNVGYLMNNPEKTPDSSLAQSYITIGSIAGSVDGAFAQNNDLDISGIKIPVGLLVGPVQRPVRWLLGVRVIDGSVQVDHGAYKLLITSTSGETWLASFPSQGTEVEVLIGSMDGSEDRAIVPLVLPGTLPAKLQPGVITSTAVLPNEPVRLPVQRAGHIAAEIVTVRLDPTSAAIVTGPVSFVMDNDHVIAVIHNPTPADAVSALADELAFRIMSSDPKLAATGMTRSWEAFQPFKQGLEQYKRYGELYDMAALSSAIDLFRAATRKDPSFAQAYYYLGLALQKDRQPGAAADAFRTSLNTNASFAAAYNALAYHLYYYDQSYVQTAASISPIPPTLPNAKQARIEEARPLWQKVISFPDQAATLADRASAYYGLCSDALDRADPGNTQLTVDDYQQPATQNSYNLAYFYCQEAERLYAVLSSEQRASPQIKQGEAAALNNIGVILARSRKHDIYEPAEQGQEKNQPVIDLPWHCDAYTIDKYAITNSRVKITKRFFPRSPYDRQALRYFQRALGLQPDDSILRCNEASTAYILNDPQPMKLLEGNALDRRILADDYASTAKWNSFLKGNAKKAYHYYLLALDEYQAAIDRDPTNIQALNGYAYTVWVWHLRQADIGAPYNSNHLLAQAEKYSRLAVRLAADKQPKSEEAIYRNTHGEVLLGLGNVKDAVEELDRAVKLAPAHPLYDEMRWDLAVAYLCASKTGSQLAIRPVANGPTRDTQYAGDLKQLAETYLQQIGAHEAVREIQPFTGPPDQLDIGLINRLPACRSTIAGGP